MLTEFQKSFITYHLRRPENDIRISEVAKIIAEEFNKSGSTLDLNVVAETVLIMNLGECDPRISEIYEEGYSWKEHPEAIDLNKLHGQYSVEIAKSIGVYMTDEQENVITEHSKSTEYTSELAKLIKISEVCVATENERFYRGEKKLAATSWNEVKVLLEEHGFSEEDVSLTEKSYSKERFK